MTRIGEGAPSSERAAQGPPKALGGGRPEVTAPEPGAGWGQVAGSTGLPGLRFAHLLLRAGELLLHVAGNLSRRHPLAAHLCHRALGRGRWRAPRFQPRLRAAVRLHAAH